MAVRNYQRAGNTIVKRAPAKGSVAFAMGEILMINISGYVIRGTATTGLLPFGVCANPLDTTGAADGDLQVQGEYGGYYVEVDNSTGADAILATDQNLPVYTLDANSVSRLSAGKSKLGIFKGFSASGRVRVYIEPN